MTRPFSIDQLRAVAHVSSGAPIDAAALSHTDARALAECAIAYGLGAATYLGLERTQVIKAWPDAALSQLRDELVTTTGANLRRASQLSAILTALQARGLAALAYKGPSLSWQAYGHIGARVFDDLDLLVAPADRANATRVLETLGYTRDRHEARLGALLPGVAHVDRLVPSASNLLPVEVHSSIAPWRQAVKLPAVALLSRQVPCPLPTGAVPTMTTEDTLITLAVHASTHEWSHIRFVSEIAGVTRRAPVNWDVLMARATGAGVAREVRVALYMACDVCSAPVPAHVRAWADHDHVAQTICDDRVAALTERRPPPRRWQGIRARLRYREGFLNKCRYAARNELVGWVQKLPWERWRRH